MRTRKIYALLVMFMFITPFAWAGDETSPNSDRVFSKMDKDKDGYICQEEAKYYRKLGDRFSAADIDGDGKLGLIEFRIFAQ